MIYFPNAKINIGLRVTERRPDGYHNLETLFYPVGLYAGTPLNPVAFCDTLEVTPSATGQDLFRFGGRHIDCPEEKNLVVRAVRAFREEMDRRGLEAAPAEVSLEKHIPDGAGLGGGSADASFTLRAMNEFCGSPLDVATLQRLALGIGADCPFFIRNVPAVAGGVGEVLTDSAVDLAGWWCVIVKPDVYVSTREAFAGIHPHKDEDALPLEKLAELPVEEWRLHAVNDFEKSIFVLHPELEEIKKRLYTEGASYAAMSGSGSSLFGLFRDGKCAARVASLFSEHCFAAALLL